MRRPLRFAPAPCSLPALSLACQYEKFNLVLRFFTGASEYTAAELPNGKKSLPFLQVQCEAFLLGRWVETGDGGLRWEWDNSACPRPPCARIRGKWSSPRNPVVVL